MTYMFVWVIAFTVYCEDSVSSVIQQAIRQAAQWCSAAGCLNGNHPLWIIAFAVYCDDTVSSTIREQYSEQHGSAQR